MKAMVFMQVALAALLFAGCARQVELPKGTALGDLVKVENKDSITGKGSETVKPKDGETIYVLNFENIKSVSFQDLNPDSKTVLHQFALTDSAGKQYRPIAFGVTGQDGTLSSEGISYSGNMEAKDGRFYMRTGSVDIPGGQLTVVYLVPKSASGLSFMDGDKKHPIQ